MPSVEEGDRINLRNWEASCHVWQMTPLNMQLGRDEDLVRVLSKDNYAGLKAFKAAMAKIKKRRTKNEGD